MEATNKQTFSKGLVSKICCIIAMICVGVVYIWSVMKMDTMTYFGWEEGAVNLISNLMLFGFCIGSFIGGIINDKISSKKTSIIGIILFCLGFFLSSLIKPGASIALFYVTYCAVSGLGTGFTFSAALSCLQKWMPHRRGLASGMATAAFGLGAVIFSPIISAMLKTMPIVNALRILAIAIFIVGMIACLLIRMPSKEYLESLPKPVVKATSIVAAKDYTFKEAIKTLPFWLLVLSIFLYNATWNMLTPLIKGLGMQRGLTDSAAVLCVSLTGAFNAGGRLIMSAVSDKIGRINTFYILAGATTVLAILLTFVGGGAYFGFVLLTAFAFGGPASVNPATCTDLFGQKYSATTYGATLIVLGLSSIAFGSLSNVLYAATGNYTATFIVGAVTAAITIVIYFLISRILKKQKAASEAAQQKEA